MNLKKKKRASARKGGELHKTCRVLAGGYQANNFGLLPPYNFFSSSTEQKGVQITRQRNMGLLSSTHRRISGPAVLFINTFKVMCMMHVFFKFL